MVIRWVTKNAPRRTIKIDELVKRKTKLSRKYQRSKDNLDLLEYTNSSYNLNMLVWKAKKK